ncbi:MAG: hypothetical protein ACYC4P_11570 [Thermoanaerobaculia bacterium]
MAFCFGCHSYAAKIVRTAPAWLDGRPVIWRLCDCPPPPLGCGERRRQIISDDGLLVERRDLIATAVTRAKVKATGGAVGSP